MSRVGTALNEPDGISSGGAAITITSSSPRSGAFAYRCASGAGNATSFVAWVPTVSAASTSYFLRGYFRFTDLPTATIYILGFSTSTGDGIWIRLTSAGDLQVWDGKNNAQIGSNLAGAITADATTWYMLEVSMTIDGSAHPSAGEGRLNGVSFASGSITTATACTDQINAGWFSAPGASKTLDVDDVALNNSSGGSQNSWPGSGNVVLLIPTATSAAGTGWRLGTNTAEGGNGWNSVNNEPPVGVADLAVGSDPKQIRNATANANDSFDATMTTYTAAGVTTGATVNVVDPITATAAPVVTSAKQGTVGVVSNPAIANIALAAGGTSGAFWSGVAANTYPTGWKWSHGTITYAPAVTLGTAPVMRITQVTSSTRIAIVCFMGMYVDYTPATAATSLIWQPAPTTLKRT